jgi:hypothetical protein
VACCTAAAACSGLVVGKLEVGDVPLSRGMGVALMAAYADIA